MSNSIPIPENWTFWHVLTVLGGIVGAAITLAIALINSNTNLKISNATQDIPRISKHLDTIDNTLDQLDTTLDDLSKKIVLVEAELEKLSRNEIVTTERLREVNEIESAIVAVNTTLGAHGERIKNIEADTQKLDGEVAEVDKKLFGTETKSENVESIVEKVSTDVESISTEINTHRDRLQLIAEVVKDGFEGNPKVAPMLKHIAKNEQQSTEQIVEKIGQLKAEHDNDPVEVTDQISVELGVDSDTARVAADERLSAHLSQEFFELRIAAATPSTQSSAPASGVENPFTDIQVKADLRGESIFSLCKKYQSKVPAGKCYDYFLQMYPGK